MDRIIKRNAVRKRTNTVKLAAVLLFGVLLVAGSRPADAFLYTGDWEGSNVVKVIDDLGDQKTGFGSSLDIKDARWVQDAGSYYFRITLAAAASTNSQFSYDIFIDSTSGGGNVGGGSITGVDYILTGNYSSGWTANFKQYNSSTNNFDTLRSLIPDNFLASGTILEWRINTIDISGAYCYWGADTKNNLNNIGDVTSKSQLVPPVPIPSAVWLLGSGVIGLIGLKRRGIKRNENGRHKHTRGDTICYVVKE